MAYKQKIKAALIPYIKLTADRIVWFDRPDGWSPSGRLFQNRPEINLYQKWEVSKNSAKKMKEKIEWMLMMAKPQWVWCAQEKKHYKFSINFITLTLSDIQRHSDKFVKEKMLNTFLTRLRSEFGVNQYIWRAEAMVNGRIHFHILINKFIHWREVRNMWNSIQKNYGYLNHYFAAHGSYDANSTDVHSIKRVRNISAYLSKYLTKEQKISEINQNLDNSEVYDNSIYSIASHRRLIEGRIWGCCYFLSNLKGLILECFDVLDDESRTILKCFKMVQANPYVQVVYSKPKEWAKIAPNLWRLLKKHIWETFNDCEIVATFNNIN